MKLHSSNTTTAFTPQPQTRHLVESRTDSKPTALAIIKTVPYASNHICKLENRLIVSLENPTGDGKLTVYDTKEDTINIREMGGLTLANPGHVVCDQVRNIAYVINGTNVIEVDYKKNALGEITAIIQSESPKRLALFNGYVSSAEGYNGIKVMNFRTTPPAIVAEKALARPTEAALDVTVTTTTTHSGVPDLYVAKGDSGVENFFFINDELKPQKPYYGMNVERLAVVQDSVLTIGTSGLGEVLPSGINRIIGTLPGKSLSSGSGMVFVGEYREWGYMMRDYADHFDSTPDIDSSQIPYNQDFHNIDSKTNGAVITGDRVYGVGHVGITVASIGRTPTSAPTHVPSMTSSPTSTYKPTSAFSDGDIAGITVGSVVGFGIVMCLARYILSRITARPSVPQAVTVVPGVHIELPPRLSASDIVRDAVLIKPGPPPAIQASVVRTTDSPPLTEIELGAAIVSRSEEEATL
jgi:hypothetical protein